MIQCVSRVLGLVLPSLLTAMAFAPVARAQTELQAIPALTARVTDQADVLSAQQEAELEALLTSFETRKGAQIAVLTVATVAPEEIEQYSIRVVDAWKLGRQGVDDGALLLVAVDDRRVRIEVGRGLEGALTDLVSNRIIDEAIVPAFRAGDYPGGIALGVERMIQVADGEPLPEPQPSWNGKKGNAPGDLFGLLFILVFFVGAALRKVFGRLFGSITTGGLVGAVVWLAGSALFAVILAALGAFFLTLVLGAVPASAFNGRGRRGRWDGGFGGGGFGGGGFGGGFGGGGGGFGGGGASGRW